MVLKNHVDADPSTAASDKDVAVATMCTVAGWLATLTAVLYVPWSRS